MIKSIDQLHSSSNLDKLIIKTYVFTNFHAYKLQENPPGHHVDVVILLVNADGVAVSDERRVRSYYVRAQRGRLGEDGLPRDESHPDDLLRVFDGSVDIEPDGSDQLCEGVGTSDDSRLA